MVKLLEQSVEQLNRSSSKGNQLKWRQNEEWYKADYTGYEGLSEYVVSKLISYSSLSANEFVLYDTEIIEYKDNEFLGCKSLNFLKEGSRLITMEELFKKVYGHSLNQSIYGIQNVEDRIDFVVQKVEEITGLKHVGEYLTKIMEIDAIFLNEDRHMNNIAFILDERGDYQFCPFFDHGASLLADVTMDYPMKKETEKLIETVKSKTFCTSFDEQLDAAEKKYGTQINFLFDRNIVEEILEKELNYPEEYKKRVCEIINSQRRKYIYLFAKNKN